MTRKKNKGKRAQKKKTAKCKKKIKPPFKKNTIKLKIFLTMVEDDSKNLEKRLDLKSTQMKGGKGRGKKNS